MLNVRILQQTFSDRRTLIALISRCCAQAKYLSTRKMQFLTGLSCQNFTLPLTQSSIYYDEQAVSKSVIDGLNLI